MKKAAKNCYEIITDRIIEQMEQGFIPWVKPWTPSQIFSDMVAEKPCYSYSTGKPYDIINQFLLGFKSGEYATFNQIKKAGGTVRKDEKSEIICGWIHNRDAKKDADGNVVVDDDGNTVFEETWGLRYYRVWNILTQVDGLTPKHNWEKPKKVKKTKKAKKADAEKIISDYIGSKDAPTLDIKKSDSAYYQPSKDLVVCPELSQYKDIDEYYSTIFHELTHSTAKSTRCDRKSVGKASFGSHDYSKEELVAEIGACFLSSKAGLSSENSFRNSVAYLQSWVKSLKKDPKMIVNASAQAQKAVDFIINANR